ncbi:MAG: hypothetical protein ACJ76N_21940 [Thermoanaerobaculia bacterium]
MRSLLVKSLAISVLLVMAAFAVGHAATAASPALLAVDACGCCPKTCLGGTFIGCYHTIYMPPNAVTCVYRDAAGNAFDCVSCLLAASDTDKTAAALNAIFEAGPAFATAAQ